MNTIVTPDFMGRAANIIAEIRIRACIDKIDTEVIEDILKDELIKYHNEVFTYGHSIGYDDGYADGKSSLAEAVDSAHEEGYELGYDEGYYTGYSESHSAV